MKVKILNNIKFKNYCVVNEKNYFFLIGKEIENYDYRLFEDDKDIFESIFNLGKELYESFEETTFKSLYKRKNKDTINIFFNKHNKSILDFCDRTTLSFFPLTIKNYVEKLNDEKTQNIIIKWCNDYGLPYISYEDEVMLGEYFSSNYDDFKIGIEQLVFTSIFIYLIHQSYLNIRENYNINLNNLKLIYQTDLKSEIKELIVKYINIFSEIGITYISHCSSSILTLGFPCIYTIKPNIDTDILFGYKKEETYNNNDFMIITSNSYLLIAWYTFLNALGLYDLGVKRKICSSCGSIFTSTRVNRDFCPNCKSNSSTKVHSHNYSLFHKYRKKLLTYSKEDLRLLSNEDIALYNTYTSLKSADQKYRTPNKKDIENIKILITKLSNK